MRLFATSWTFLLLAGAAHSQADPEIAAKVADLAGESRPARRAAAQWLVAKGEAAAPALIELLRDKGRYPLSQPDIVGIGGGYKERLRWRLPWELTRAIEATEDLFPDRPLPSHLFQLDRPPIVSVASVGSTTNPRLTAAWILGQIAAAAKVSVPALLDVAASDEGEPLKPLTAQCARAIRSLPREVTVPALLERATTVRNDLWLELLARIAPDDLAATSLRLIETDNEIARANTWHVLAPDGKVPQEAVPTLLRLVQAAEVDPPVVALLGMAGEPVIAPLAALLTSDDAAVRQRAIAALARSGKPAAAAAEALLRAAREDPDPRVRQWGIEAMVNAELAKDEATRARVLSIALENAKHEHRGLRVTAVASLAWLGDASAPVAERLLSACRAEDVHERHAAVFALSMLTPANEQALTALALARRDANAAVRNAAREAYPAVRGKLKIEQPRWSDDADLAAAIRAFGSDNGDERRAAAERLRKAGEGALPALTRLLAAAEHFEPRPPSMVIDPDVLRLRPPVPGFASQTEVGDVLEGQVPTLARFCRAPEEWPLVERPRVITGADAMRRPWSPRVIAAWLIGLLGSKGAPATANLWAVIAEDEDETLQWQAAEALIAIGPPAVEGGLARLDTIPDWRARRAAEHALVKLGRPAFEALLAAVAAGERDYHALEVLHRMELPRSADTLNRLLAALRRGKRTVGPAYTAALLVRYGAESVPGLLETVRQSLAEPQSISAAQSALAALASLGLPGDSVGLVRQIAGDESSPLELRKLAVLALGEPGVVDERATGTIERLIAHGAVELRLAAVVALTPAVEKGGDSVIATVTRALADADWRVRVAALRALAATGDAKLAPRIEPLTRDADDRVRGAARDALVELGR